MADFLPDKYAEIGQDPHLLVAHSSDINLQWNQNHCGIFRSTDGSQNWKEITQQGGPANFGFAIALDEEDINTAWVVPGVSDELRIAVDKALCVCKTDDGGKSLVAQRDGLPQGNCFDIVYRHGLDIAGSTLAIGSTTGNLYMSSDKGDSWKTISQNLAQIYSVKFAS